RHILSTRRRFRAGDLILGLLGLRSLYRNIGLVAGEEGRKGFRSSFFLLTSNYSLGDLVPSITPLEEDGWEIGLHGDFGTHDSLSPTDSRLVFDENTRDSTRLDGHNSVGLPEARGAGGDGRSRADDRKGQEGRWSFYPSLAPGSNKDAWRKAVSQNSREAGENGLFRLLRARRGLMVG